MTIDMKIANDVTLMPIQMIADKLHIDECYVECYGKYKAKINLDCFNPDKINSKLILVTAINPTQAGEGKTTVSIGLADGLNKIGEKTSLALREPSMGPVFGLKGGATGGGYSQVVPTDDINLHFTGDMHAITSATNLIAAVLDNHIYHGNKLNIDINKVFWKRCLDVNDRSLRAITTTLYKTSFTITAASEIMAILCLVESLKELKEKLNNIIVALDIHGNPITVKKLNITDALIFILKDAIKPNLIQTLEGTPVFMHGGPFANIAHGCNSILATKMAMQYSDYVVTEAGFGADLGAEKFLNIKCRKANIKPDCVVLVATLKALKLHGGVKNINDLTKENIKAIEIGFNNLLHHYYTIYEQFKIPVVVALNKFVTDLPIEIEAFKKLCDINYVVWCLSESWELGGNGAIELAKIVKKIINNKKHSSLNFSYLYDINDTINNKIDNICFKAYNVNEVIYDENIKNKIETIKKLGYANLPICIAKTPLALNDGSVNKNQIHIKDISIAAGAGFLIVKTGNIMTMPGLPEHPLAEKIKFENN